MGTTEQFRLQQPYEGRDEGHHEKQTLIVDVPQYTIVEVHLWHYQDQADNEGQEQSGQCFKSPWHLCEDTTPSLILTQAHGVKLSSRLK